MDMTDAGSQDTRYPDQGLGDGHLNNLDDVSHRVDEINSKVDTLDQRLSEVEQFYSSTSKKQSNNSKGSSIVKDKNAASCKKRQSDAASREVASSKRMQELIRQFGTIMRQLTQHKWASPFMDPVDVKGLELDDYFEVIKKPMDFSTIKAKMEAKDGNGYKNVREICADVRLIFKNAMKYNDERHDVHVMAKTLLEKFEEKWLQLLPKVDEEEKRRKDEEAEAHLDMQLAQEAAHAKMALDLRSELEEVDRYLESLREMVLQKCRRITTGEKRRLGTAISELSPENLSKVLQIVAQGNPNFQPSSDEVELDMDAQSEATLWKLKFFVKEAVDAQGRTAAAAASVGDVTHNNTTTTANNKRKICDALAKTSQKKSKKLP